MKKTIKNLFLGIAFVGLTFLGYSQGGQLSSLTVGCGQILTEGDLLETSPVAGAVSYTVVIMDYTGTQVASFVTPTTTFSLSDAGIVYQSGAKYYVGVYTTDAGGSLVLSGPFCPVVVNYNDPNCQYGPSCNYVNNGEFEINTHLPATGFGSGTELACGWMDNMIIRNNGLPAARAEHLNYIHTSAGDPRTQAPLPINRSAGACNPPVPLASFGGGDAYVRTFARRHLWSPLNRPMTPGKRYYASMRVSTGCIVTARIDNLSMLFSNGLEVPEVGDVLAGAQVRNTPGNLIELDWVQVAGEFSATDAFDFVTIGPFNGTGGKVFYIDHVVVAEIPTVISPNQSVCEGTAVDLEGSGCEIDATYFWSDGTNTYPGIRTTVYPTVNSVYNLFMVIDGDTIQADGMTSVIITPAPALSITGKSIICKGESTELCGVYKGRPQVQWSSATDPNLGTTKCITVKETGDYTITATFPNGCVVSETFHVHVVEDVSITGPTEICEGDKGGVELCAVVDSEVTSYTLTWLSQSGTQIGTTECITVNRAGTYTVIYETEEGCKSKAQHVVTVTDDCCPEKDELTVTFGQTYIYAYNPNSYVEVIVNNTSSFPITDFVLNTNMNNFNFVSASSNNGAVSISGTTVQLVNPIPAGGTTIIKVYIYFDVPFQLEKLCFDWLFEACDLKGELCTTVKPLIGCPGDLSETEVNCENGNPTASGLTAQYSIHNVVPNVSSVYFKLSYDNTVVQFNMANLVTFYMGSGGVTIINNDVAGGTLEFEVNFNTPQTMAGIPFGFNYDVIGKPSGACLSEIYVANAYYIDPNGKTTRAPTDPAVISFVGKRCECDNSDLNPDFKINPNPAKVGEHVSFEAIDLDLSATHNWKVGGATGLLLGSVSWLADYKFSAPGQYEIVHTIFKNGVSKTTSQILEVQGDYKKLDQNVVSSPVEKKANEFEVLVYPNPNITRVLHIQLTNHKQEQSQVHLLDAFGKEVKRAAMSGVHAEMQLHNLESGVYLLKVVNGASTKIIRVIL